MTKKYRVQAIHFADEKNVTVQLQGIAHNGSYSSTWSKDEAAEYPVGSIVELSFEVVEEGEG